MDFDLEELVNVEQTWVTHPSHSVSLLSRNSIPFAHFLPTTRRDGLWGIYGRFYEQGYKDGYAHGRVHGLIEGRALGREKGFEMWEELGFYEGFARMWDAVLVLRGQPGVQGTGTGADG